MKKKKKQEPIILSNVELMPTTIGSLETKENGPIVVVIIIALFALCIYFLPTIISYLNGPDEIVTPPPIVKPEEPKEPDEPLVDEITYYPFNKDLSLKINGFHFSKFKMQKEAKTLLYTITNESGTSTFFVNHNFYLELYAGDNKLLQRIRLPKEELMDESVHTIDITEALANGTISKIAIREIKEEDYPSISLRTNETQEGYLTCKKDTQEITYFFQNKNNEYQLQRIEEEMSFQNTLSNYEEILNTHTTLATSLKNVNGVETDLVPTSNGFLVKTIIDLENITNANFKKYFTNSYYYNKNTLAKVIDFELKASAYICS